MFGLGSLRKKLSQSPLGAINLFDSLNIFREIQDHVYTQADERMTDAARKVLLEKYRQGIGIRPKEDFKHAVDAYIEKQIEGIEAYLKTVGELAEDDALSDEDKQDIKKRLLKKQAELRKSANAFDELTVRSPVATHPDSMRNFAHEERGKLIRETADIDLFELLPDRYKENEDGDISPDQTEALENFSNEEFLALKGYLGTDDSALKGLSEADDFRNEEFTEREINELEQAIYKVEQTARQDILEKEKALRDQPELKEAAKKAIQAEIQTLNAKADQLKEFREQRIQRTGLGKAQAEAQEVLGDKLNETVSAIHAAAEIEQQRIKIASLLVVGADQDLSDLNSIEVTVETSARIHDVQRALKDKNSQILNDKGGLQSLSGQKIEAKEVDGNRLSFTMQFPGLFLGSGYYTDSRNLVRTDMESLVELVKATGAKGISLNIRHGNPEWANHMAREAYMAARNKGYAEKDIEILIGGVKKTRKDLFTTKELLGGDKEQDMQLVDPSDDLAQAAAARRKPPTRDTMAEQQREARKLLNQLRKGEGLLARDTPDIEHILPPPVPKPNDKPTDKPEGNTPDGDSAGDTPAP